MHAGPLTGPVADRHDRAAFGLGHHDPPGLPATEESAQGVDIELAADIGRGHFLQRLRFPHGRRGHQGVEPAETVQHLFKKPGDGLLIGHVSSKRGGIASQGLDLLHGFHGRIRRSIVMHGGAEAPLGQRPGDRAAHPPLATAGYQCDFECG